jgi:hypothetical protein
MKKSIATDLLLKKEQREKEKKDQEKSVLNIDDIDFAFTIFMTKDGQVDILSETRFDENNVVFNMADTTAMKVHHILSEALYVAMTKRMMQDFISFGGKLQKDKNEEDEKND